MTAVLNNKRSADPSWNHLALLYQKQTTQDLYSKEKLTVFLSCVHVLYSFLKGTVDAMGTANLSSEGKGICFLFLSTSGFTVYLSVLRRI